MDVLVVFISNNLKVSGLFRYFHKIAEDDHQLRYFYTSVRPSAWNNSVPTGQILIKSYLLALSEHLSRKFKFL